MGKSVICKLGIFALQVHTCLWSHLYADLPEKNQYKKTELEILYEYHVKTPSDINEHISSLRDIARECSSVTEVGARSLIPTWGILQGLCESSQKPCRYIGIDIQNPDFERLHMAKYRAIDNGIDFAFWHANDMEIEIEPTDMLFLDFLHTYCHLTYQLETFSPKVKKYICIHDTSAPWGHQDDSAYRGNYSEYPSFIDRSKRGLWPAIEDFLTKHPEWKIKERRENNHGFTILERKNTYSRPDPVYHSDIDFVLKNKVILCTGPARNNRDLLVRSTEADMTWIPFKKIFVVTNDPKNMDVTFKGQVPSCQLIADEGKQLDCLNCLIFSIKNAVNDPDVKDDDIILFKHESVYINDMDLIKKAIGKILGGYGMVVRLNEVPWYQGARGSDVFFVKVSSIKEIINSISKVTALRNVGDCCEKYYTDFIVNSIKNVYNVPYKHSNGGFTELGFYHIYSPFTITDPSWDKKNRDQLFSP